ncbi:Electron transfer flavoprotein subunit alpha [Porphyridium purpureum]|uniref:Electron transfer flavoprotein subunit alpha n=1 Tax=Porphyridium purpureum TaxID=35688 RepID=A0A5J4Z8P9_PORPP|nr:Electron transfer flavoprotein subunit alpha [Porphyridium purpureum]|eukprot:POR7656..scf295_1
MASGIYVRASAACARYAGSAVPYGAAGTKGALISYATRFSTSASGSLRALVLADVEPGTARLTSASLSAVTAARQAIGADGTVAVLACVPAKAGSELKNVPKNLSKCFVAEHALFSHAIPEHRAPLVVQLQETHKFSHVFSPASTFGKALMPRVAALLDVSQVSDIVKVESASCFVRPIYAGNALATVEASDAVKVCTVRATAFEPATASDDLSGVQVENTSHLLESFLGNAAALSTFESEDKVQSARPELGSAKVVVSGGRGFKNGENFKMLEGLADKLGAAVGATRAAVDAGYCSNDMQVGQTGKIIAPELYIGVGLSGAIQHLAGMKDSKYIVAINKDPEAPIFQVADYGLVGDLFEVLPELESKL